MSKRAGRERSREEYCEVSKGERSRTSSLSLPLYLSLSLSLFVSHSEIRSGPTANQVRKERPAVSSRDVTQVPAAGTEGAGGQCS